MTAEGAEEAEGAAWMRRAEFRLRPSATAPTRRNAAGLPSVRPRALGARGCVEARDLPAAMELLAQWTPVGTENPVVSFADGNGRSGPVEATPCG
jgi:hypothetical protein